MKPNTRMSDEKPSVPGPSSPSPTGPHLEEQGAVAAESDAQGAERQHDAANLALELPAVHAPGVRQLRLARHDAAQVLRHYDAQLTRKGWKVLMLEPQLNGLVLQCEQGWVYYQ